MKKIIIMSFLFIMISTFSFGKPGDKPFRNNNHDYHSHKGHENDRNSKNSVGAPLDGSLLAVLGAAGVAWVVARKKKKNPEA